MFVYCQAVGSSAVRFTEKAGERIRNALMAYNVNSRLLCNEVLLVRKMAETWKSHEVDLGYQRKTILQYNLRHLNSEAGLLGA